jgi:DNA replication and repair protein RecF
MWLTHLEADRLRNLKAVGLGLAAGLTMVHGRNGQGKSTLLEGIYLLATGRSFRTRQIEELIFWDGGPLRVAGKVASRVGRSELTVVVDEGTKSLLADGGQKRLEEYIGRLDVVDLTGERMKVLRGAPEERRRFLDRGIVALHPAYLRSLGDYRRVLQQRNALLRGGAGRGKGMNELDAWDERLIIAAAELHSRRREYAVLLASTLGEIGRRILDDGQELTLRYRPSPAETAERGPDRFAETYAKKLAETRERDLRTGHTCRGPHRDEMAVELEKIDLRRYGSAGQLRASMIALKLGKLSLLHRDRGEAPLFLMDDFDSDLDEGRASAVAAFLDGGGFQAVVATSKEELAGRLGVSYETVRMEGGRARVA